MSADKDLDKILQQAAKVPPDLDELYTEVVGRALDGTGNDRQVEKLKNALEAIDEMVKKWDAYQAKKTQDAKRKQQVDES